MAGGRDYDARRLEELTVYIAECSADDPHFGKIKLNKELFFSDFRAFQLTGQSVTGAVYQHLPMGPAPQQMLPVFGSLKRGKAVRIQGEYTFGGVQERVVPLRAPDLTLFSGVEIAIVDQVIRELWKLNNSEVSELSHDTMAWRLTHDYQEIPYGTALLCAEAPSEEDIAWAREVAANRGRLATA